MNSKRQVNIDGLTIGGEAPVRVESMLKVALDKREECTAQCERLKACGCEMARAAFPEIAPAPFFGRSAFFRLPPPVI